MPTEPTNADDAVIDNVYRWFSEIYLGGIPAIITNETAFLAFVCTLTATEALAGYLDGDHNEGNGARFRTFVERYFPPEYKPHAGELWNFRNSMIHGFSTGSRFVLTHHNSWAHLSQTDRGLPLNSEDFYGALLSATKSYFLDVRGDADLRSRLVKRVQSAKGGMITVGTATVI